MAEQLFTEHEYQYQYDRIKRTLTEGNYKSIFPLASLLGGQPGSGKSQLSNYVMSQNPNSIIIDGDYIRQFHPHLKDIEKAYGVDYPKITQPFVNRAVEQLIDELSKEQYNLIIEGTLRDINIPKETAHMLNQRNYIVELYVVATDKELSWQSTINRGDKMKEGGEIPRYVDKAHHDQIVERLPETVGILAMDDLFFNVTVMNRAQEILYDKNQSPDINPVEVMEKSLEGEPVMSLKEQKREIEVQHEHKNKNELTDINIKKNELNKKKNMDFER